MLRNGLAALAGVIAAVTLTMLLQLVVHWIDPPSKALNNAIRKIYDQDPAVVEEAREIFARELPKHPLQLVLIIVTHAAGTFFGSFTAVRISREAHIIPASIVAGLMLLGGVSNVMLIPHPTWFNAVDLLLYIPAALFAWKLVCPGPSDNKAALLSSDGDHPTTTTDES